MAEASQRGSPSRGSDGRRSAPRGDAVVLDASVVLALLYGEPGQEEIRRRIRGTDVRVGAVNVSEVSSKLAEAGLEKAEVREALGALSATVHPFDEELALEAGQLRPSTRECGLSLGDRSCLALANSLGVAALTTDSRWEGLENVKVVLEE